MARGDAWSWGGGVRAAAFALAFACAGPALGDLIYLSDGTWIRGKILKETADDLEIDGKLNSGIAFVGKLARSRVRSITKTEDEAPAPTPAPADKPGAPAASAPSGAAPSETVKEAPKKKDPPGDFLVIPMKGTFGEDICPKGVDAALDWAVEKGVRHAVFVIDSGGGQVWAADRIRQIIHDHENKVTPHVVIRRALSASLWVVFGCQRIGALPGSTLGAAVAFTMNSTGNAEVDEKFNSAIAATIASDAERLGHSGELARAMILTDVKLFARKKDGEWSFTHDQPRDPGVEVETLADGHRVVTLTAEQMIRFGVAHRVEKAEDAAYAELLGDADLKAAGPFGETAMRNAAEATKGLRKAIDNWVEQVLAAGALFERAVKTDDVDAAIEATENYLRQLRRIGALKNSAKELGMLEYPSFARIDVAKAVKAAEDAQSKLKELKRSGLLPDRRGR